MEENIPNKGTRQEKKKKLKEKKKTKSEVKISKLPNKEFEAMIIMMSNETQEKDG